MTLMPLAPYDLAAAAMLISASAAVSIAFRLGLVRSLAIAAIRMLVQLTILGAVLALVLDAASLPLTLAAAAVMVLLAGLEIAARLQRPLAGLWTHGLGTACLLAVGCLVVPYTMFATLGPEPWWAPRQLLAILGLVLAPTLAAIALALDVLTDAAHRERSVIEARLALGATRLEAFAGVLQRALRAALLPVVSTMSVAGLAALPAMMTGQIMAGADPVRAVRDQILVLLLAAFTTASGAAMATLAAMLRLTDARHRLRLDRLAPARAE